VTDASWLDRRRDNTGDRSGSARRRKRYLPSEQVVNELVSLVPDLSNLADELRNRLTDPALDTHH
jgi:hypothetical protein